MIYEITAAASVVSFITGAALMYAVTETTGRREAASKKLLSAFMNSRPVPAIDPPGHSRCRCERCGKVEADARHVYVEAKGAHEFVPNGFCAHFTNYSDSRGVE